MSANKPVHVIRFGLMKAVIWHNVTKSGERYNAELIRIYRNGDTWKESKRFGRDESLLGSKLLDLAHTWMYQQERMERDAEKATG